MSFFEFPNTRTYDSDLGWVIAAMKALKEAMETFIATNALNFAEPLLHDLTTAYNKNTIVLDPVGNAYISIKAVPAGISLSNTEYWLMVFDYEAFLEKVNKNFTGRYYRNQNRATSAMSVGDWLTFDDVLCKVTAAIAVDDIIEVGTNIVHFTLEDFIKNFMTSATNMIQQYKNDIDASELAYRQQLALDIANTTASLQAQLDLAISGATVDSEVINARLGANGVTYSTLGDAIREQITDLTEMSNTIYLTYANGFIDGQGVWHDDPGGSRKVSSYVLCAPSSVVSYAAETNHANILAINFYDRDLNFISGVGNVGPNGDRFTATAPANTKYCRISTRPEIVSACYVLDNCIQENMRELNRNLDIFLDDRDSEKENLFNIEEATFNLSLLSIDDDGFLYRSGTLPTTHQNYAWMYSQRGTTGFKTSIKIVDNSNASYRFGVKSLRGDILYINVYPYSGEFAADVHPFDLSTTKNFTGVPHIAYSVGVHDIKCTFIGDYINLYIDNILFGSVDASSFTNIRAIDKIGYSYRGSGENGYIKPIKLIKENAPFIHISFDDQLSVLKDITTHENDYTSIFDNADLNFLKSLHDEYNCKFTLMLFYQDDDDNPTFDLSMVTSNFASEFKDNSEWLKFAYHGPDPTTYPATMTTADLVTSVSATYAAIATFADQLNIDTVPRLSYFSCTSEQAETLHSDGLTTGYLTADDNRANNCGLSGKYLAAVRVMDYCVDYDNDIRYYRSTLRMDDAETPTTQDAIDRMNAENNDPNNNKMFVIFAHNFTQTSIQNKLTAIAQWADKHNMAFDYPMNANLQL